MTYKTIGFDAVTATHIPMTERVLDRLGDILYASDEILDMIRDGERLPDESTIAIERSVRSVYDQVNELMKRFCD